MECQITKKSFDLEYSTQFRREVEWYHDHGIEPSFIIKPTDKRPIQTYKYTKTSQLFALAAEFYHRIEAERRFEANRKKAVSADAATE